MNYLLSASLLLLLLAPAYFLLFRYSERYALNRLLMLLGLVTMLTLPTIEVPSPIPVATQVIQGSIEYLERSSSSGEFVSLTTELRPSGDIALQINGNWQTLPVPVKMAYRPDQVDTPPPNEKLVCLLGQHRENYHDSFLWHMSIKGKLVDEITLKEILLESKIVGNPIHYYLED